MKRTDLLKQVVPLDLEGLEVLDGEMLFVTGGFGVYASGGNGCGCSCSCSVESVNFYLNVGDLVTKNYWKAKIFLSSVH